MNEVLDRLSEQYGWSKSVPNFSGKLKRGSLRCHEADLWRKANRKSYLL